MQQLEERIVQFDEELQIEAYRFVGVMQKFPNHFHEYYAIGLIEKGNRHFQCNNQKYPLKKGDILFLNPYDNHSCISSDQKSFDYRCLNINTEVIKAVTKEITGHSYLPTFHTSVVQHEESAGLLHKLHQMIMGEIPDFEKQEIFYFLMQQLLVNFSENATNQPPKIMKLEIEKVCTFIDTHYSEPLTLDDLAAVATMNKFSFLRSFTKMKGVTPYRYIQTVRINAAKKQLESGLKPMEVALITGFTDQSHFSHFFMDFIGLTPGQYREIFHPKEK